MIHFVDDRKYYQHLYPTAVAVEEVVDSAAIELPEVSHINKETVFEKVVMLWELLII